MTTMSQNPMKGKRKSYLLRINEDLWDELNQWASLEFRSVNGQIEMVLKRAVDDWKTTKIILGKWKMPMNEIIMNAPNKHKIESESIIEVQHLVKSYGRFFAVNDVSFSIKEGEIFGIIGPNGAGKTTTVECISGLRMPDSGSISIYGLSPQKDRNRIREFLGVQLQEGAMPPRLRVGEAVELFASFYPHPADPDGLLQSLGIKDIKNSTYKSLSGGQKQRLSIALALVGNPKVAILDELTTGLDPEARRETWALIERFRDGGVTVILVTHFMDEAERLCNRLALINHGKLVALDTPEAIAALAGGTKVRFVPSKPIDDKTLYAIPGVSQVERKERYITVMGTGDLAASIINSLAKIGASVSDIEARTGNLDDAFIKLTRDEISDASGGTSQ
jgi:ABC-2 type transport system ATP-binding protein